MSTPPPPDPAAPPPEPPSSNPWLLFALISLSAAVLGLIGAATLYLTWQHPTLATPITAAGSLVGLLVAVIGLVIALAKR
ncbi:hypothetical protein GT034_15065 [Streptomyces sp. SID2563]|uniref:hypothetical protein n=1 Tax=Streptomyces sp. SID2563 TaxID=2690255 RepID=UPI001368BC6A|nr:hypothetical protein [Streptomyces sp. SID2563]MYW08607.1 hypothetical protein [Streptomyces sp. SID2563]MYW09666.1 hypothetical protein [Streptomyces sp. SID2563]